MEAVFAIFAGLCFTVVPIGLIFGFAYWRQRVDGRSWSEAARQLGMTLEPYDASRHRLGFFGNQAPTIKQAMIGTRGGLPIRVWIRIVVTGSGKNRQTHYYTNVAASLPASLGLGLGVTSVGWVSRLFTSVVGERDLQVGIPELDERYTIKAAEPEHAALLLRTPYVAEAMIAYAQAPFSPYLHDGGVGAERKAKVTDAAAISRALDVVVDLAQRVASARAQIGPTDAERAVREEWSKVASARGLTLDVAGMRMGGRAEGMHVEVATELRGQARWTTFTVRFDRPLGVGLRLAKQSGLHTFGKLLGMQDIETGDRTFDDRFVVKGAPTDRVRAILTPELRARLVELQDRATQLTVQDDHVAAEVAWLVADAQWVDQGIVTVARAGAALAQVVGGGIGPYRQ